MAKKSKSKPKEKDKTGAKEVGGCDTATLYKNYVLVCQSIGIEPYDGLKDIFTNTPCEQIIITSTGSKDEQKLPTRALISALNGHLEGSDLNIEPFTALTDLRIRSSNISDTGAYAVAAFIRASVETKQGDVRQEKKLQFLDLSDNNIGHQGALHLGRSFEVGMNKTITTLILDFNSLGQRGISSLCKGLGTNSSLKVLSLKHCGIDPMGGDPIASMLTFIRLALTTLDLSSNNIGGIGLNALCRGLEKNTSLTSFRLADNNVRQTDEDLKALEVFGQVLIAETKLSEIDLNHNLIGNKGAKFLLPGVRDNKQITTFKVSEIGMDKETYEALFRVSNTSKKAKKGKKK